MKLPITTTKEEKFVWIVEILGSTVQPFKSLRPRERQVLAQLYYYNTLYKNVPKEFRAKITFSSETLQKIVERLGITMDNMYNILVVLRKKGLIGRGDQGFNDKFLIEDMDTIAFNFSENN